MALKIGIVGGSIAGCMNINGRAGKQRRVSLDWQALLTLALHPD